MSCGIHASKEQRSNFSLHGSFTEAFAYRNASISPRMGSEMVKESQEAFTMLESFKMLCTA